MSRLKAAKQGERLVQLRESAAILIRDLLLQVLDPEIDEYNLNDEQIQALVNEVTAELDNDVGAV